MTTVSKSIVLALALLLVGLTGCEQPAAVDNSPHYAWEQSGRHLLAFTCKGCMECQRDKRHFAKLREGGLDIIEIDREKYPELIARYHVPNQYPYYVALEDGVVKAHAFSLATILVILKALVWVLSFVLL